MDTVHGYLAGLAIPDRGKLRDRVTAGALAAQAASKHVGDSTDATVTMDQLRYYLQMAVQELQAALDSLPDERAAGSASSSSAS
jgi:hypothetical protein